MSSVKEASFKALDLFQMSRVGRFLNRKKVRILIYHSFTDQTSFRDIENYQGMRLNCDRFRAHLKFLSDYFNVIPLEQVVAHYSDGADIPDNAVAITIDDGYLGVYDFAFPLLQEFNTPAAFFLSTEFVNGNQLLWHDRVAYSLNTSHREEVDLPVGEESISLLLGTRDQKLDSARILFAKLKAVDDTVLQEAVERLEQETRSSLDLDGDLPQMYQAVDWDQVNEMVQSGLLSVGSHSRSHSILTRCSPEVMLEELQASKETIEKMTGRPCTVFCYPNGTSSDFDDETRYHLKDCGYTCGLTTVPGMNDETSDVLQLKRVSAPESLTEFSLTLSGVRQAASALRRII